MSHAFRKPAIIRETPKHPLPNPDVHPAWYGEIWVTFAQSERPEPILNGHVQRAKLGFAQLLNSVSQRVFGDTNANDDVIWDLTVHLMRWYDALPESLSCKRIAFPSQLSIQ